jgi:hypothetical protein
MRKRATIGSLFLGVAVLALYRFRRPLLGRLFRITPGQYAVAVERDAPIPMRDGVTLLADHFAPTDAGDCPTLLVRTPYGRPSELGVFGLGQRFLYSLFAEQGYHVIVQSTRGRFKSEGHFEPFAHEAADGHDTLAWISNQPWFNGALGLWGLSYLGYVQWAVVQDAPPYLKALMPILTSSRFSRLFYPDGTFTFDGALRWSYLVDAMEGENKRLDRTALLRLLPARRESAVQRGFAHLPINEADVAAIDKPVHFYRDWLTHNNLTGSYWQQIDHHQAVPKTDIPIHLIAGWYDIFLPYQLNDYFALLAAGRTPYLTIGPQYHLDFSVVWDSFREGLTWFAVYLKGEQDRLRKRPVRIYVMGADEWHEMDYWPPPAQTRRYYLHTRGQLQADSPAEVSPADRYRYAPSDPTPMIGGALLNPTGGPRDQRALEARPDVLTYTTSPLESDLDVIGPVRLELYVCSSLPYTDFVGRLCDVYPDGRSINICDGICRIAPGKGERQADGSLRIDIDMWSTAQRFRRGHRIRLQVASGAHPRWVRNLGTGESIGAGVRMAVADQAIYHDKAHPSALVLPIVTATHRGIA